MGSDDVAVTSDVRPEAGVGDTTLKTLDQQKFSWYHVKAILVAGVGFFTDAYDLFVINVVVPIIGYVYFSQNGTVPVLESTLIKGAAVVGTFIGQVTFGIISDKYGRKKVYGLELALIIIGTIGSALSCDTVRGIGMAAMLTFWRFVMGIGIGGDYPVSAIITSEYASVGRRGQMMAAVFAMQGIGTLVGAIVAIILLAIFEPLIQQDPLYADYVWRLLLGLGVIPALVAVYFRVTLPETPRYTIQVEGEALRAKMEMEELSKIEIPVAAKSEITPDEQEKGVVKVEVEVEVVEKASFADFRAYFGKWDNMRILIGCSVSWFLLDIAYYGLGLNQSIILTAIGYVHKGASPYQAMWDVATGNAILSLMGTVPGYWFTVFLIEKMGRINIQLMGFSVLTVVFVVLSAGYTPIQNTALWLFIVLYCIGLFFFNFGPNTTTFIVPGEVFPTRYRSTGHGISAGSGKLGAIISTYSFTAISAQPGGVRSILGGFSVVMFLGILSTLLLSETKGRSLEQLSNEGEEEDKDNLEHAAYYYIVYYRFRQLGRKIMRRD